MTFNTWEQRSILTPQLWHCCRKKEFQIIIYCGNYFGHWGFDFIFLSNEDDISHSTQMTFPDSIKGRTNALSASSSLILAAEQTDSLPHSFYQQNRLTFNTRRALSTKGHCSFWRLFFCHLFIPPRPTGSQNFRLNA